MKRFANSLNKYGFLLSLIVIMAVYLPVNSLGFTNFDDVDVVNRIHDRFSDIQWYKLFFRPSATTYYRPLLEILCYLDYALWGLSVTAWHLTNYILHMLNASLVYLIAANWLKSEKYNSPQIWASFSMLIFALNPMTCESVAWISGRSDLAATFFSLLAFYISSTRYSFRYVYSAMAILSGLLCKESAAAVIPLIFILKGVRMYQDRIQLRDAMKRLGIWSVVLFIPLACYLFLRTNGFDHLFGDSVNASASINEGIKNAISTSDPGHQSLFYIIPVTAFYIKKLFIFFPLNFAIMEINTRLYSLLFVLIFFIGFYCLNRRYWSLPIFLIILMVSFSPSLIIATGKVAWAPMAERYLYQSLSVMAVGSAMFSRFLFNHNTICKKLLPIIFVLLILINIVFTYNRQFVFNDSETLWSDTLKKNPGNSMVLCKYGQSVEGEERCEAFSKAVLNPKPFKWRAKALVVFAQCEMNRNNHSEAFENIEQALKIENNYKNLIDSAAMLATVDGGGEQIVFFRKKALEYYYRAYKKKRTAFVLYKIGSLHQKLGETIEARKVFNEVIFKYGQTKYASFAEKQLSK